MSTPTQMLTSSKLWLRYDLPYLLSCWWKTFCLLLRLAGIAALFVSLVLIFLTTFFFGSYLTVLFGMSLLSSG